MVMSLMFASLGCPVCNLYAYLKAKGHMQAIFNVTSISFIPQITTRLSHLIKGVQRRVATVLIFVARGEHLLAPRRAFSLTLAASLSNMKQNKS